MVFTLVFDHWRFVQFGRRITVKWFVLPKQRASSSAPTQWTSLSQTLVASIHVSLMWHQNSSSKQFVTETFCTLHPLCFKQSKCSVQTHDWGTHVSWACCVKHSTMLYFSHGQSSSSDPKGQSTFPSQYQNSGIHLLVSSEQNWNERTPLQIWRLPLYECCNYRPWKSIPSLYIFLWNVQGHMKLHTSHLCLVDNLLCHHTLVNSEEEEIIFHRKPGNPRTLFSRV